MGFGQRSSVIRGLCFRRNSLAAVLRTDRRGTRRNERRFRRILQQRGGER